MRRESIERDCENLWLHLPRRTPAHRLHHHRPKRLACVHFSLPILVQTRHGVKRIYCKLIVGVGLALPGKGEAFPVGARHGVPLRDRTYPLPSLPLTGGLGPHEQESHGSRVAAGARHFRIPNGHTTFQLATPGPILRLL